MFSAVFYCPIESFDFFKKHHSQKWFPNTIRIPINELSHSNPILTLNISIINFNESNLNFQFSL
jgi:hypothetical protein